MATDAEIGTNLTRIRGSRSQKDVADAMRDRGFKWSQATVWSVEKGERPLRLTEAQALGSVLRVNHDLLLAQPEELDLHAEAVYFTEMLEDIRDLAYESYSAQLRLARAVDDRPESERAGITLAQVVRNAIDAAAEGLARADEHARTAKANHEWTNSLNAGGSEFRDAFLTRIQNATTTLAQTPSYEIGSKSDGIDQAES